jgi:transcription-repair coupling factor (superfamily II helicase)
VGFELYCKLLEEKVNRGPEREEVQERPEPVIELKVDAFLPSDYIPEQEQKLSLYRRIVSLNSLEEAEDLKREIEDRYGKLPASGRNLLRIASLKLLAKKMGITLLRKKRGKILIEFSENRDESLCPQLEKILRELEN